MLVSIEFQFSLTSVVFWPIQKSQSKLKHFSIQNSFFYGHTGLESHEAE